MTDEANGLNSVRLTSGQHLKRGVLKLFLFGAFTVLVLNPNLKRAAMQVQHTLAPESLIQTNFPGIGQIQDQLDRTIRADAGGHAEARLVARFVLKKIKYVSDYENWGNLEYWPSAREVWAKRQEDCDGRAIFATSLLRARGFHSARLVVGLDHMWIRVNENEKDPSKPPHFVSLLSPNPDFSMELQERSMLSELWTLAKAFLNPTALRETVSGLFAEIPPLRKAILISGFLLLCSYPVTSGRTLLATLALGLLAANLLANWEPDHGHAWQMISGGGLIALAALGACLRRWFGPNLLDEYPEFALAEAAGPTLEAG